MCKNHQSNFVKRSNADYQPFALIGRANKTQAQEDLTEEVVRKSGHSDEEREEKRPFVQPGLCRETFARSPARPSDIDSSHLNHHASGYFARRLHVAWVASA
jgi:hypothetical protein